MQQNVHVTPSKFFIKTNKYQILHKRLKGFKSLHVIAHCTIHYASLSPDMMSVTSPTIQQHGDQGD